MKLAYFEKLLGESVEVGLQLTVGVDLLVVRELQIAQLLLHSLDVLVAVGDGMSELDLSISPRTGVVVQLASLGVQLRK